MQCIRCSCKIKENGKFYIAGDMGPEIIALLKQSLGILYDRDGHFCSQCLTSITKLLPPEPPESDDDTLSVVSSIPSVSIKSEVDSDVTDDASEDLAAVSAVPVNSVASESVGVESLLNGKLCHSASKETEKRHIKILALRQKDTGNPKSVLPATVSTVPVNSVRDKSLLNGKQCHSVSREAEERHIKIIAPIQKETENPNPGSSDPLKLPRRKPRIHYPHDLLSSPMRKMSTTHSLTSNEKHIALNIYKYINKMTTTYPYKTDVLAQVAEIMGTSRSRIYKVLHEFKSTGRMSSPPPRNPRPRTTLFEKLDANEIDKIKKIAHQLEVTNEVSLEKVLTALKEDTTDLPKFSRTTFYRVLKRLNIKLSKSRNPKDVE